MEQAELYNRQAAALRALALARRRSAGGQGDRALVVVGARPGCGATTIAVNLAAALRPQAGRVVLLDACGPGGPCQFLGLEPPATLEDVAGGRVPLARTFSEGPAGLRVVAAGGVFQRGDGLTPWGREQLRRALAELHRGASFLVAEADAAHAHALAAHGDMAVVGAPWAAVEAYSTLKQCAESVERGRLGLVVNRAASRLEATRTIAAIAGVSARRLGFEPRVLGFVAEDPCAAAGAREGRVFAVEHPRCQASRCLKTMVARLRVGPSGSARQRAAGGTSARDRRALDLRG